MRHINEPVEITPPGEGWKIIARRRFQGTDQIYNIGCEVPAAALGRNSRWLFSGRYVEFVPPGTTFTAMPSPLPPPPVPNPEMSEAQIDVLIVRSEDDPVGDWFRLVRACGDYMGGRCNEKWLCGYIADRSRAARELHKIAIQRGCAEARAKGLPRTDPASLGL